MNTTQLDQEAADKIAEYVGREYEVVEEFGGIAAGVRVRNAGEQYTKAYREGTADVVAVLNREGSWAKKYGRPDVEVLIRRDNPRYEGQSPLQWWADYGTCIVEVDR